MRNADPLDQYAVRIGIFVLGFRRTGGSTRLFHNDGELAFFLALACALSLPLSDSTSPTFSGLLPWVSLAGLEAEAVSEPASEPGALNKA
jgi:hypothetical protein